MLYLIHIELTHGIITSDRNEIWVWDLYHSTALVEVVKSLAPSNVKDMAKYRTKNLGYKVYGTWHIHVYLHIAQCISAMRNANSM